MLKGLIYGGGAVGLGIASCLLKSSATVTLVARENTIEHLLHDGLRRKGIFGDFSVPVSAFECVSLLNDVSSTEFDYVLVCTKSSDSPTAAADLAAWMRDSGSRAPIVLFQNGWGNAEIFTEYFPKKQVFNARVITGFTRPRPNEVEITVHADAIHAGSLFGERSGQLETLCQAITDGGIPCQVTDSIEKDLWAKMLYNCALNPLGAILDVPYGALAEVESTRQIMDGIIREVYSVLAASGYQTHWATAEAFLDVFYTRLVPTTAQHKSSTLQDIRAHKRTEIDALNGAVIKLAEVHGINVPYNRSVYSMVKFLEGKE